MLLKTSCQCHILSVQHLFRAFCDYFYISPSIRAHSALNYMRIFIWHLDWQSLFCVQELGTESLGTCTDFQAVPGCGIRCLVSNTENLLKREDSDSEENQHNAVLIQISDARAHSNEHPLIMDPQPLSQCHHYRNTESEISEMLFCCSVVLGPEWLTVLFVCCVISAVVQTASYTVLIGNREWMRRNALQVRADVDEAMMEHERRGRTAVLVAVDSKCVTGLLQT